ncbi:MAG: hypothetical protein ACRDYC_05595 [Acidimicrobiales bacterium]
MDAVLIALITSLSGIAVAAITQSIRHGRKVEYAANGTGIVGVLTATHDLWQDCEKRCQKLELRIATLEPKEAT